MPLLSPSLDTFLATAIVLTTTYIYLFIRQKLPIPRKPPSKSKPPSNIRTSLWDTSRRTMFSHLMFLHTLYVLYSMIVLKPPNIFTAMRYSVGTPTDTIRSGVQSQLAKAGLEDRLPPSLEMLLKRLGSFELRVLYVRFGHNVVSTCEYCRTYDEFAMFAFPGPLIEYVREMFLLGILTIQGTNREVWRKLGVWSILIAAFGELYWTVSSPITIPRPKVKEDREPYMLHDNLRLIRHTFFVLWPVVILYLPERQPAQSALTQTVPALRSAVERLHAYTLVRSSIHRIPYLRNRMADWWDEERKEGHWIRKDENVKKVARGTGVGFEREDEELRVKARDAAKGVMGGIFGGDDRTPRANGEAPRNQR